jgi:lipoprotein-anchoring transpeptidase ErfK/SrfK
MMFTVRGVVLLLALASASALVAGCGARSTDEAEATPTASKTNRSTVPDRSLPPRANRCRVGPSRSYAERGVALVLRRPAAAYRVPGGPAVAHFDRVNVNGVPTTFRALVARLDRRCQATWYRVQLPIRPNGAQGWVEAADVRSHTVDFRILVDLSDRRITVFRGSAVLARVAAAVGRPETPTPTGSYYVNQRLLAPDPTGPWGPGGIGISAFSPVLVDWPQGGPIAIHGTNEPATIGQAASHGCLRIDNAVLERLIHVVPDGTPVRIRV